MKCPGGPVGAAPILPIAGYWINTRGVLHKLRSSTPGALKSSIPGARRALAGEGVMWVGGSCTPRFVNDPRTECQGRTSLDTYLAGQIEKCTGSRACTGVFYDDNGQPTCPAGLTPPHSRGGGPMCCFKSAPRQDIYI